MVQVEEDLANPGSSLYFQSSHFNNQVRVPGVAGAGRGGPGKPGLQPTLSVQSLLTIYAPMNYTASCSVADPDPGSGAF